MQGRKQTPTALKVLRGTTRPDRLNPNEPAASPESPQVPPFVTGRAAYWFGVLAERVAELGIASRTSSEALGLAAVRAAEVEAHTSTIDRDGTHYETENSSGGRMIRPHPAVAQRADAMRHLQSLLAEFGLTPASLGKVSVNPRAEDASERFFN